MTERLYYRNAGLKEFEADVISSLPSGNSTKHAARWHVFLDRTAFYPTSGGQPNDIGTLGGAEVMDVFEDSDNRVVHVTNQPLACGRVRGKIAFARRFDHMQQHTGSHILSAAFLRLYGIPAISFHLGHEVSTIDVATPSLSQEQLRAAEQLCNDIIREDLAIEVHLDERREMPSASARGGATANKKLRLIEIQGLDVQPCGGTHVGSTGQIGLLLLRKTARLKANCRIEFVCGVRAAQFAQKDYAVIRDAAQQLSCTFANLPTAIATVVAERDASVAFRDRMREDMARLHADFLLGQYSKSAESGRVITHIFDKQESAYLKLIALRLMEAPGTIALLGSRKEGCVVFAQSPGLPTNMRSLLESVLVPSGGKGGGMKDIAQGMAANQVSLDLLLAKANEKLTETLTPDKSVLQKSRDLGLDNLGWAAT